LAPGIPPALEAGAAAGAPTTASDPAAESLAPVSAAIAAASSPAVLPDGRLILNLATADDLRRLPGIGPKRARAIIDLRQRLAKFRAVEDLMRVKGIGRKIIQRIKPGVVVDRPPDTGGGPTKPA
jgi:competence protein ComEA